MSRLRWVPVLVLLVVALAIPALAHATLVYLRKPLDPVVWVAEDSGKNAHELAPGSNPRVSPDGRIVAFLHQGKGRSARPELMLAPTDGSAPVSRLASGWRETSVFDWSPDSASIAAVLGPELGAKRLVLIDTITGAQQTIASGFFSGVSFSPEGGQLVYSRAASEDFPPRSDVYRYDIPQGETVRAVQPVRLTRDGRSLDPLWGPNGKIVFVKQLGAKQRKYGPKNELYLMNPAGKQVRRLTHTKVGPLLQGLYPTAWSADGKRLLAEFEGQDTSEAWTVRVARARAHRLTVRGRSVQGAGISRDGATLLVEQGGLGEPASGGRVATIPFAGGRAKVVVAHGAQASWNG